MQDVASRAGVSPSTVSLVLNNRSGVADSTRQTVLAVVEELEYVPLLSGRPRTSQQPVGQTNRIALLACGVKRAWLNAPVYIDVLHSVEAALAEVGKSMLLRQVTSGAPDPGGLLEEDTDGVILFGSPLENLILKHRLNRKPCVRVMGETARGQWYDQVTYDNRFVGELAARYVLDKGHRHVTIIAHGANAYFDERRSAFEEILCAAGGTCLNLVEPNLILVENNVERTSPEAVSALLDQVLACGSSPLPPSAPTALFLMGDVLVPGVQAELLRRGLTPGKDIDIVSCNNEVALLAHMQPRPATIDIHAERVGRKAVEQLLWRIEHPTAPRVTLTLEPTLVPGTDV